LWINAENWQFPMSPKSSSRMFGSSLQDQYVSIEV
jgi:hypothetical protein